MRAAVVGAGVMGRWHVQALRRLGHSVVAIVDSNLAAASTLARGGMRAFEDLEACLEAGRFDVVHVCTPVGSHVELVRRALDAGCHVLVEKPLAPTSAETRSLLAQAEAAELLLAPVHQFPFQRGFRRIVAERPRLGELVRLSYRTCSAGGDGKPPAARHAILTEILPHPVSLFLRLLPELEVSSLELQVFDDHDLALAGRSGGILLEVFISLRGRPTRNELEVIGTDGSAWADLFGGYAVFEGGHVSRVAKIGRPFRLGTSLVGAAGVNVAARASRWEPAYPGLRELIREFHAAAADRAELPVTAAESLAVAELMDAVSA